MPDRRPHSGMLFCQLDSHSTRPSLPHVLLHPPCQHVWPSEQPFVVVAQMKLLYTSFHSCCIPHNKSTINMHIHICTDYTVFPVELLHNGGDCGDYFIATPTSLVMSNGTWYWVRIHHHIPLQQRNLGCIQGYSQTNQSVQHCCLKRSYGTETLHKVMKWCALKVWSNCSFVNTLV